MILPSKKIIKILVVTKSGRELGYLDDFDIETESQSIIDYYVIPRQVVPGLFKNKLIINRGQIIDILADKIIVSDNLAKDKRKEKQLSRKKETATLVAE